MTDKSQGLNECKMTCCLIEEVELDHGQGNVEKGRGQLDSCTGRMWKPDNKEQLQCLVLI